MIYQNSMKARFSDGKITVENLSSVFASSFVTAAIPKETETASYSSLVSENGNLYSFCDLCGSESENIIAISGDFPPSSTVSLSFSEEPAPYAERYTETVKTAENDFLHLTVNDSGTLVISDKMSGNVYFEMLTAFAEAELSESCSVTFSSPASATVKFSSPLLSFFDIRLALPSPKGYSPAISALSSNLSNKINLTHRVALAANERALRVTSVADGADTASKLVLRFPTGADYPAVILCDENLSPSELSPQTDEVFSLSPGCSVTVTSDTGSAFRFTPESSSVELRVTEDGNIDVFFPAISAEACGNNLSFSYLLEPCDM